MTLRFQTGAALAGGLLCLVAAKGAMAQSLSPLEQYWATFGAGDTAEDVPAALDAAGATILGATLNGTEVLLGWDAVANSWDLALDGLPVGDIVTGADEWNRPTFAAVHDAGGVPLIEGFADVDNNGILVIEWDEAGYQSMRLQASEAAAVAISVCGCSGTGGTVTKSCLPVDCDNIETCRVNGGGAALGYCKWKGSEVSTTPS